MAKYPKAIWTPAAATNHGGPIGKITLGVMHIEQGTESGTNAWFKNPAAQVSSHFGVGKDGKVYQFVDTSVTAWAEVNYNGQAISIEHEGMSGTPLTPQQIAADEDLYVWIYHTHGVPLARTTDPTKSGWIGHGELGVEGGNHISCPGAPILAQINTIIAGAKTKLSTPNPSSAQLAAHGYVLLSNPVEAALATKNGWAIFVWNGVGFSNAPASLPVGTHEYASKNYKTHNPAVAAPLGE